MDKTFDLKKAQLTQIREDFKYYLFLGFICILLIVGITVLSGDVYATENNDNYYGSGQAEITNPNRDMVGGFVGNYDGTIKDRDTKVLFKNHIYYKNWREFFYNENQNHGMEFRYDLYCEINEDYENFIRLPNGWFN